VSVASLVLIGAFGLVVGSFLNVCAYRIPRGESIVWPGSRCPACGSAIRWFDNIPVLSYAALGGRCRRCRAPIAVKYPLIELSAMLLFVAHAWAIGWQPLLVVRLLFSAALIVLFVIDLEHQVLPNRITLPGAAVGLAASLFVWPGWRDSLLGLLLGAGILWGIAEAYYRVRREEGLGMGDVKMLAMIGAFLGWQQVLVTLVLSSLAGSLVGLALIAAGRGTMKYALPFGTFLALAAAAASLIGPDIVAWYVSLYA
jgi:leader peptidase (prepilin peptidase)/N-methyltransferase